MQNTLISYSEKTVDDLLRYGRMMGAIDRSNYDDYSYYRTDVNFRDNERKKVLRFMNRHLIYGDSKLIINGESSRLRIGENKIEFVPGQYAPSEFWGHVLNYLEIYFQ